MNHDQLALVGPILSQKIKTDFPQIAVDGGIQFATDPILWVGDGDSGQIQSPIPLIRKTSQNETDLRFCLNQIQSRNWRQLHFFGFLGKRKDHEWANLGEVCQILTARAHPSHAIFYDECLKPHIYLYQAGNHSLVINGIFSIFSFEIATVSISGDCDFAMKDQILQPFSGRGISNVGHGTIHFHASAVLMVIVIGEEA